MIQVRVGLVDIGDRVTLNLSRFAAKLNSLQKSFLFDVIRPITEGQLGNPEIGYEWYSSSQLFDLLRRHPEAAATNYVVGVTGVKFTDTTFPITNGEKSYFSLSDQEKVSVISIHRDVLQWKPASKTTAQYVGFLLMCELLINIARTDLSHDQTLGCLFDECEDRSDFAESIDAGRICVQSRADLSRHGVPHAMIADATRILRWIRSTTIGYDIRRALTHPVSSLAVGATAGWVTSLFTASIYFPEALSILVGVPTLVFLSMRYGSRRRRNHDST